MMKIQIRDFSNRLVFELHGRLIGAWVPELEECWHRAAATHANIELAVDLHDVSHVDQAGYYLLRLMRKEGVRLVGNDLLLGEIMGPNQTL